MAGMFAWPRSWKERTLNRNVAIADADKVQTDLSSPDARKAVATWPAAARPEKRYGWLSRLRSYFIFDPLIWMYTIVLGSISLICSLFDRGGRIQHNLARAWSWLIMKTILSPVTVMGSIPTG